MDAYIRKFIILLSIFVLPAYADPILTTTPEHEIELLGQYGENGVGLYKNKDVCFITFNGHRDNENISSIAVMLPKSEVITIYPMSNDAAKAVAVVENIDHDHADISPTNDTLIIEDNVYTLFTNNEEKPYNNLAAVFDNNPAQDLIRAGAFIALMADTDEIYSIGFGTNGLSEALAAYRKNC